MTWKRISKVGALAAGFLVRFIPFEYERKIAPVLSASLIPAVETQDPDTSAYLQSLTARLKEKDIGISISDSAMDTLGALGFDPVYGARPLKREIQQAIENPVAMSILAGEFEPGDRILVDIDDSQRFSFAKQTLH